MFKGFTSMPEQRRKTAASRTLSGAQRGRHTVSLPFWTCEEVSRWLTRHSQNPAAAATTGLQPYRVASLAARALPLFKEHHVNGNIFGLPCKTQLRK